MSNTADTEGIGNAHGDLPFSNQTTGSVEDGKESGEKKNIVAEVGTEATSGFAKEPLNSSSKQSYYEIEFAKIQAGKKTRFNWFAFLLGPLHQVYHGSGKQFRHTFLPFLISFFTVNLISTLAAAVGLITLDTTILGVAALAGILAMPVSVWGLVLSILYGKNCNKNLFQQVQGKADKIPCRKGMAAGMVAVMLLGAGVVSILPEVIIAANENNETPYNTETYPEVVDSQEMDNTSDSDATDTIEKSFFESPVSSTTAVSDDEEYVYPDDELNSEYYSGRNVYLRCCQTDEEMDGIGFDNALLIGDTAMTLGNLFSTTFESYFWNDTYTSAYSGQGYFVDVECHDKDRRYYLRFFAVYGDINITSICMVQQGGEPRSLSETEASLFMADLCNLYHNVTGTAAVSIPNDIQGVWISDIDGTEVSITDQTINGFAYECYNVIDNTLYLWLSDPNNEWLHVSFRCLGDKIEVYEFSDDNENSSYDYINNSINDCFVQVDSLTRVA